MPEDRAMAKILLVEDNELNADMLSRRLVRSGHAVVIAVDGTTALAMAVSEHPELILMDVRLPDIDGWEVTRRLKTSHDTSAIPIIALTANTSEQERQASVIAGCDDHVGKPIDYPLLLQKIEGLALRAAR